MTMIKDIFSPRAEESVDGIKSVVGSLGGNLDKYSGYSAERLREESKLAEAAAVARMKELPYNGHVSDAQYGAALLAAKGLSYMADLAEAKDEATRLVDGMVYYVAAENRGIVAGYRCMFKESRENCWVPFRADARTMKVMEVLKHGEDEDFTTLYLELADGRNIDAANGFVVEHITECSDEALDAMSSYCDSRWEGSWPWEQTAPRKLRRIVENDMANRRISDIRNRFDAEYDKLFEGEVEQSQVILLARKNIDDIEGMIADLGKLSAELMTTMRDQMNTEFGQGAGDEMEAGVADSISGAVDALSKLRSAISDGAERLEGQIGSNPEDAMGIGMDDDGLGDELAGLGPDMGDEDGMGDLDAMGDEGDMDDMGGMDDLEDLNADDEDDGDEEDLDLGGERDKK